ncbi:MAG: DUF1538 domain-containing protein [Bacilli bacterium]
MNALASKIKDNAISVLPILVIVLILNFTVAPIEDYLVWRFVIGAVLIIFGLSLFLLGVDLAIEPLGGLIGKTVVKSNKLWLIIAAGLVLGFFISIAEPDLIVLADQVQLVSSGQVGNITILIVVSVGMAIMVAFGFLRIIYKIPLNIVLTVIYAVLFIMAIFASNDFISLAFDASGATTGILAVPFILALSFGISKIGKDSKSSEKDSFGLVAIASTGPIAAIILLNVFKGGIQLTGEAEAFVPQTGVFMPFVNSMLDVLLECLLVLAPLIIIFIILQLFVFKLQKKAFWRIIKGFIYALIGIFIFLVGVEAGFVDGGRRIGESLTSFSDNNALVTAVAIIITFILGAVTILAEPAVKVLGRQIEDVTSGYVKKRLVFIFLAIGVGIAISLSVVRILTPGLETWHLLLPGFGIACILSFFVPELFVGIAFDAGGVATGPITVTFILPFVQGIATSNGSAANLVDGFGMIALVAMMPIITLQILGIIYKIRTRKKKEA